METCTGMAERVVYVRVARPASVNSCPFHIRRRAATASTSYCSSVRLILVSEKGVPRYLVGKSWTRHGNTWRTASTCGWEQRMGVITHLSTLVTRPEAPVNKSRMRRILPKSSVVGDKKITR
jgi:hypothetical protein